jgi:anti-sigma regulatory factor (Ser/Thr protein kinase)
MDPVKGLLGEVRAASVVLLPHAPSSVAVARQRLCAQLLASGVAEPTVADATVIVSELVSNALRHARPLPSGEVRVAWNRQGDIIEVSVSDGGASTEPRRGRPTLSSLGGRGLGIVESLADCWGVRHEDGATTVWALLHAARTSEKAAPVAAGTPIMGGVEAPAADVVRGTR